MMNVVSWVSSSAISPWRIKFYSNKIGSLSSMIQVKFKHIGRSANASADSFDKEGMDGSSPFTVLSL